MSKTMTTILPTDRTRSTTWTRKGEMGTKTLAKELGKDLTKKHAKDLGGVLGELLSGVLDERVAAIGHGLM
jgi:hypothetical protein